MTGMVDRGDDVLRTVATRALDLIVDGAKLGLGTGRAAAAFIAALGERVRGGLRVTGVPTSSASARLAGDLGIPLVELTEDLELDLTIDGADEVAPTLDLIKGKGGALVRERIVASASKRQVILVGKEKLVDRLGEHGTIPVEVIAFALGVVVRRMKTLGLAPAVRPDAGGTHPFVTESGNLILDCAVAKPVEDPHTLDRALRAIAGVVDTGLFLGTAERVLVGFHAGSRVEVLTRRGR